MGKLKQFAAKTNVKTLLPAVIVVVALAITGGVGYALTPKQTVENVAANPDTQKASIIADKNLPTPTVTPMPKSVLGTSSYSGPSPIAAQTTTNTTTQTTSSTNTSGSTSQTTTTQTSSNSQPAQQTSSQTSIPTATPQPTAVPTQAPTAAPVSNTVSMQVQDPGGNSSFTVTLTNGANACDVLQEAKNEGKINSVTLSDAYMSSLHSLYVTEINGYSNNWTFTVNGSSPAGCSLINPKPNDTIVWKFG